MKNFKTFLAEAASPKFSAGQVVFKVDNEGAHHVRRIIKHEGGKYHTETPMFSHFGNIFAHWKQLKPVHTNHVETNYKLMPANRAKKYHAAKRGDGVNTLFEDINEAKKESRRSRWDKMRVGYTKGDHVIVKIGGRTEKVHVTEVGKHNSTGKSADGVEHIFAHREYFAHVNESVNESRGKPAHALVLKPHPTEQGRYTIVRINHPDLKFLDKSRPFHDSEHITSRDPVTKHPTMLSGKYKIKVV